MKFKFKIFMVLLFLLALVMPAKAVVDTQPFWVVLDNCESATNWSRSVGCTNTSNPAVNVSHVQGQYSLSFSKDSATTTVGGITKGSFTTNYTDFSPYSILHLAVYLPDTTNISQIDFRLGDSSSHYNTYTQTSLTSAAWNVLDFQIDKPTSQTGNGCTWGSVNYFYVGVVMASTANLSTAAKYVDEIRIIEKAPVALFASLDGLATSAKQDTGNTSLGTILTNTGATGTIATSLIENTTATVASNVALGTTNTLLSTIATNTGASGTLATSLIAGTAAAVQSATANVGASNQLIALNATATTISTSLIANTAAVVQSATANVGTSNQLIALNATATSISTSQVAATAATVESATANVGASNQLIALNTTSSTISTNTGMTASVGGVISVSTLVASWVDRATTDTSGYRGIGYAIKNSSDDGTKACNFKVLAGNDGVNFIDLGVAASSGSYLGCGSTQIADGAVSGWATDRAVYKYYKVQLAPENADVAGTIEICAVLKK